MNFDPLILDPAPPSLWLDFQAERRLPERQPSVVEKWQRCRELGVPLHGPRPEDALDRGPTLAHRIERLDPLLACGDHLLERIAGAAARHDYSLLVSDTDGVIVHAAGGGAFADYARRVRLLEGAGWNEAVRGTNAIGTALAEGRPVFVRGNAHYARDYHELVCYAAPIRDAAGTTIAVLDATSSHLRADRSVALNVLAAAQALGQLLRTQAYARAGAQVTRALAHALDRMRGPAAVVEPPGRIARLNDAGRALLGGATSTELPAVLGLDFAQLASLAAAPRELRLPATGRDHLLRVEPIESDGRLIALLVFFEPVTRRRSKGAVISRASTRPAAPTAIDARKRDAFADLFAEDAATRNALTRAAQLAPSDIPIVLLAETGAGKELVARGIHRASRRASGPFVPINCGAIASSLLESELFGYGPGSFTGADRRGRDGYLRAAAGGTLFLDEVAEMPLAMQAALLRFLENGSFQRVGETRPQTADVRVVCATCRNLPELVARGEFRSDLYYRLKGATLILPPLRARTDLLPLARHLLRATAARGGVVPAPVLSPEVEAVLAALEWPGNVRELSTTLEVALVLAGRADSIRLEHLPPELVEGASAASYPTENDVQSLAETQSELVRRVLNEANGNVSLAAKRLGVARSTLYRMMRRYGLAPSQSRRS